MRSTKLISYLLIVLVILFVMYLNTPAGERSGKVSIGIQTLAAEGGFTEFQQAMIDKLKEEISSRGYELSDKPEINILFTPFLHENELIVSVFTLITLPEPPIDEMKQACQESKI